MENSQKKTKLYYKGIFFHLNLKKLAEMKSSDLSGMAERLSV